MRRLEVFLKPSLPNARGLGLVKDIAGLCDATGHVFALMPHPERYIRGIQHPRWTREGARQDGDGFQIFVNAVKWVQSL